MNPQVSISRVQSDSVPSGTMKVYEGMESSPVSFYVCRQLHPSHLARQLSFSFYDLGHVSAFRLRNINRTRISIIVRARGSLVLPYL